MDFDAPTLGGAVKAVFLPYLHSFSIQNGRISNDECWM